MGETPLKDLVEALEKGGGGGQAAVDELAGRKDRKTVKAVAKVLKSKRSTTDAKVLAARALGAIGLEEGIKPLAAALDDEDYRVLDEATAALGEIGLPEASAPLARAAELMGEWYDDSFQGAREISTTEYHVRLKSFRLLADALAAVGDADAALPVLEKELVERVLTPRRKPRDRPALRPGPAQRPEEPLPPVGRVPRRPGGRARPRAARVGGRGLAPRAQPGPDRPARDRAAAGRPGRGPLTHRVGVASPCAQDRRHDGSGRAAGEGALAPGQGGGQL